jgi:hypothetical protein
MGIRKWTFGLALMIVIVLLGLAVGLWGSMPQARGDESAPEGQSQEVAAAPAAADDPLILSYAAKFVCLEPVQAATFPSAPWFKTKVPIVQEETDVLIHNPNDFTVTFYKKATLAQVQSLGPAKPGDWVKEELPPDGAIRVNCDEITKLLTGDPNATFIGKYGIGTRVEGFAVVGIGPSTTAAGNVKYSPLDVTAEYSRSSEVLKKDINYQPWWWYWWWKLPWNLGHPYERIISVSDTANIDCRDSLYLKLYDDVGNSPTMSPDEKGHTGKALEAGQNVDPTTIMDPDHVGPTSPSALVAMIGRCDKYSDGTGHYAAVDYVLLSNRGPTDPNPIEGTEAQPSQVNIYPWYPGRWYDLTVVMPQNVSKDLNWYLNEWHTQRWIDAGTASDTVRASMKYFFPYWCGWGYWYWWWHGNDCIDIGVGEGESIDVEQITPVRVIMSQWPPP